MISSHEKPVIAIVGCTGAVGVECVSILAERRFPLKSLRLFASPRSAGKRVTFRGEEIEVEALEDGCFARGGGVDIAIFSAGKAISLEWGPRAVAEGAFVVDNSSAFRMDPATPLVVPEINGEEVDRLTGPSLIANPNCSTIIALMAVTPLHRAPESGGVERMVVSTYQAASGAGAAAMAELEQQARDWSAGRPLRTDIFGRQYLFNLFSHNSKMGANGYNEEEMKMVKETHKIWGQDARPEGDRVRVSATCVRVPVLRAHSEAINLTFRGQGSMTEEEAREILSKAPGVTIVDDRAGNRFPEPIQASGKDDVLVGRIRADISQPPGKGLDLFVSGDQLRKGAALNAVQIAERVATLKINV
jgi:aspartate-semialdehyde dehydrogenase